MNKNENSSESSTAMGCLTFGGFIGYLLLVDQVAKSGSAAGIVVAIAMVLIPLGALLIWWNTGIHGSKKASKISSSPRCIYLSYKNDRSKYGAHSLLRENRDDNVYNAFILLITQEVIRLERDALIHEKRENENYIGRRFYQTKRKFWEITRPHMEKIDLRLSEISVTENSIAEEIAKLSDESESLQIFEKNLSSPTFDNLVSRYSEWLKSDKIDGKPPVSDLSSFKRVDKDYRLLATKVKPITLNTGEHCFHCFPSVVILFNNDGFFLDALSPRCMSAEESIGSTRCRGSHPHDATVTGHTWDRTRVDGGPDRRYSGNSIIYFTKLANLVIDIIGEKLCYSVSNLQKNTDFFSSIQTYSSQSLQVIKPLIVSNVATAAESSAESEERKRRELEEVIKNKYT